MNLFYCDTTRQDKMNDSNNEDKGKRNERRSVGPVSRWKTPPMSNHFQESSKSTLLFAAQSRNFSNKRISQSQSASTSSAHTPKFSRTNPFEDISSLEFDKCSPGLFIAYQSNSEKNEFKWSIEDISRIMPAQIDSPTSIQEEYVDEKTERSAQEAIERYFSFHHAVASPPDEGNVLPSPEMSTPPAELLMVRAAMNCCTSNNTIGYSNVSSVGMVSAISSTPCARSAGERRKVIKIDESSQTLLSFPATLPPEIEEVLRPFMIKDDIESEECNISNSTLRRKLFSNKDFTDSAKSENINEIFDSPIAIGRPRRIELTPDDGRPQLCYLSSPDISPIKFKSDDHEFTQDMSIDCSSSSFNYRKNKTMASDDPINKLVSPTDEEHHQGRGIFSSTVQSLQLDRVDTGCSTMEVDSLHSVQSKSSNKN